MLKIGQGYDLHRLKKGKGLKIGGVFIPCEFDFVAHSDGDVLIHAVLDSILSPVCQKNIGEVFPDSDAEWKDADSLVLLKSARELYFSEVKILNIDATVVTDKPKLAPYLPKIREVLSEALNMEPSQIGVKGKTSEGTRKDCVECFVSALLEI